MPHIEEIRATCLPAVADAREEYKTLCEFLRSYATLRFYQLALLLGTSGGIATALSSAAVSESDYGSSLLRLTGLIVAIALTVMEFRASGYWHHVRDRVNVLSDVLRYCAFPASSRWSPLTTTGAGFYLHILVCVAWAATLVIYVMHEGRSA